MKRDKHLFSLAKGWLKVVGKNHYCLQVLVSLWRQIALVESHTHIQDSKDQVMKSHAYGLRRSAAVLDRAAVAPVPSSKHRPACRPLQQSSAERARADKGHMAGTLGCGGLTWARLTWILREIVAAPTLDVIKGLMLSLLCLTRSSCSLAGCVICLASRCKGGFCAMSKLGLTYAVRAAKKSKPGLGWSGIKSWLPFFSSLTQASK